MHILANTLIILGLIISGIVSLVAWIRALNDEEVRKLSFSFGTYIFKYPKYLLMIFFGLVLSWSGFFIIGSEASSGAAKAGDPVPEGTFHDESNRELRIQQLIDEIREKSETKSEAIEANPLQERDAEN
jgi:hypothetical protein